VSTIPLLTAVTPFFRFSRSNRFEKKTGFIYCRILLEITAFVKQLTFRAAQQHVTLTVELKIIAQLIY